MRDIWEEILGQETKALSMSGTSELEIGIDQILTMRISELPKHNIALKIHSKVLGCEIWFCSNERMVAQVKRDDSEAVIYTVAEMIKLINLNPGPEDLKNIQNVKSTFPGSKIGDGSKRDKKTIKQTGGN